jgi:hypothetical protein
MTMYEIVFRPRDGADDVILTNADPRLVRQVTIQGERWNIVKAEPGEDGIDARPTVAVVPLHT